MPATVRRPRKRPPLRYDWSRCRVLIDDGNGWGTARTFYRARLPYIILNAERAGAGWRWALIHFDAAANFGPHFDGGTAGTLGQAKEYAEAAALRYDTQPTLWRTDDQSAEDNTGDNGALPF